MTRPSVSIITLGCARNEVDSEELAAELAEDGWDLVDDPAGADTVLVNTCGFIDAAKRDSIDTVLAASDLPGKVVAVGCLAERYGEQLAQSLPEADAVLGFDAYPELPSALRTLLAGGQLGAHTPRDRRGLQPSAPTDRSADLAVLPGHVGMRRRLSDGPVASVKLASGCDRRCTFCAIPSFRGSFVSRRPTDVVNEVAWLVGQGVLEVNLGGVVNGCRAFARRLVERGTGGHIVNVASMAAYAPLSSLSAYCTSKAAVYMFSDCLRAELDAAGVGLTTICPGLINTNIVSATGFHAPQGRDSTVPGRRAQLERMFEIRRYGPDKVAAAILSAVSKNKAVRPVTPEAYLLYAASRLAPQALRSTARGRVL